VYLLLTYGFALAATPRKIIAGQSMFDPPIASDAFLIVIIKAQHKLSSFKCISLLNITLSHLQIRTPTNLESFTVHTSSLKLIQQIQNIFLNCICNQQH